MKTVDLPVRYQIKLRGRLGESWSDCFHGMTITRERETTTLTGDVADQAALRGIMGWIWDLNLTVVSVSLIEQEQGERRNE
ncbi:MAG: hypothetical protein JW850_01130 [Thermoflexales bacterium]|nr:hypothetical protein [Thermoflexales bacterium]